MIVCVYSAVKEASSTFIDCWKKWWTFHVFCYGRWKYLSAESYCLHVHSHFSTYIRNFGCLVANLVPSETFYILKIK